MYGIFCTIHHPRFMISSHHFYDITPTLLTSYPLYLWHHIHCIDDITPTELLKSHLLYMMNHIHCIWHHSTECVSSHPLFQRYNTLCMYDIKPTLCIISYALYKAPHPHFPTPHQIIYEITCPVFMTSLTLYLQWHPPYLCNHNDSMDGLRITVCMTSHPLYVGHLMHSTQCHIHSVCFHTILVISLEQLHSGHHTHYIWHHTHDNTNVISAIWPLYRTLHPLYL